MDEVSTDLKGEPARPLTECELRKAYYEDESISASEYVRLALKAIESNKPVLCTGRRRR